MNKLSKKFICGICLILGFSCLGSIVLHTKFLEKYYLYQKRTELASVCEQLTDEINSGLTAERAVEETEMSNKVLIVSIKASWDINNEKLNDEIREAFLDKGIGFQKYWLWEEDYEKVLDGESRIRLYKQESMNYSLLIEYKMIGSQMFAVTMIIPNIADAFGIISNFLILVSITAVLVAVIFITFLTKKITEPLNEFEEFAVHMEKGEFMPLEVQTKDELKEVADSLNSMGSQIITYQNSLKEKNQQMEQLLDNVAHDLKTPISLIQLYAEGMKDGLDDGVFLDTIISESHRMSEMVNSLLYVSRMDKKPLQLTEIDLTGLLDQLTDQCSALIKEYDRTIHSDLEEHIMIESSDEMMRSLLTNLLTNAVKYSSGPRIEIRLSKTESEIQVQMTNETDNRKLDLSEIWEPYYVGEQSRNKKLSGTGLGLTIVKKICETLNYSVNCSMEEMKITFTLTIPVSRMRTR